MPEKQINHDKCQLILSIRYQFSLLLYSSDFIWIRDHFRNITVVQGIVIKRRKLI